MSLKGGDDEASSSPGPPQPPRSFPRRWDMYLWRLRTIHLLPDVDHAVAPGEQAAHEVAEPVPDGGTGDQGVVEGGVVEQSQDLPVL